MDSKNNNKLISSLFAVSAVLLAVAFVTITNTFAYPSSKVNTALWDVYFTEPSINGGDSRVIVSNDKIDFNVSLKESGDEFSFITSINNDGTFDAKLSSLKLTDLSSQVVGTSKDTGKTYYICDYISFAVKYSENNDINAVNVDSNLTVGDKLKKNTKNNIIVTVKYKDLDRLTSDQIKVLNENVIREDNYLVFNLDLNISAVYQQM